MILTKQLESKVDELCSLYKNNPEIDLADKVDAMLIQAACITFSHMTNCAVAKFFEDAFDKLNYAVWLKANEPSILNNQRFFNKAHKTLFKRLVKQMCTADIFEAVQMLLYYADVQKNEFVHIRTSRSALTLSLIHI